MFKVPKQSYTAEFRRAAVQRVKDGPGLALVARELGVSEQTLRNGLKAEAAGKLNAGAGQPVTPEQMELSPAGGEQVPASGVGNRKESGSILREGPAVRYAWISQQVGRYPLLWPCGALSVSINGYRAWKRGGTPVRKRRRDTQLLTIIRTVHAETQGAYGSPRMAREIRTRGYPASKSWVERLIREHGIRARHKRRYRGDDRFEAPVAGGPQCAQS